MPAIDWSNPTIQVAAIGLGGIVLVAILSLVGAFIGGRISARGAHDAAVTAAGLASAARREARQDHRDDMQRDTLLILQEALTEWMRAITRIYLEDIERFRTTGARGMVSGPLDEDSRVLGAKFMYLTERVRDDGLRALLTDLRSRGNGLESLRSATELAAGWMALSVQSARCYEALGSVLRGYL